MGHQVLDYPNGDDSKIPFQSRIGTKLIVGFLIIATITGSVGYLSLYYSQTVANKFHELVLESLPDNGIPKRNQSGSTTYWDRTNEYVFIPGNGNNYLQEINEQKSNFNNNLNKYESLIDKYFPDEKGTGDAIRNIGVQFISNADKLVKLKQQLCLLQTRLRQK